MHYNLLVPLLYICGVFALYLPYVIEKIIFFKLGGGLKV